MARETLDEFEQLVLLACLRRGAEAHTVAILDELEERHRGRTDGRYLLTRGPSRRAAARGRDRHQRPGRADRRLTTASLPALRHFLEGEAAYRAAARSLPRGG
jgi:hypothetical protein